ncbi:MAG: hypothetical protein K8T10_16465 [Candidatus Eremiobacteraeota bacterium]|nr:hypothetical protein [Candidatus Eremiobacteraeota bacterium]
MGNNYTSSRFSGLKLKAFFQEGSPKEISLLCKYQIYRTGRFFDKIITHSLISVKDYKVFFSGSRSVYNRTYAKNRAKFVIASVSEAISRMDKEH